MYNSSDYEVLTKRQITALFAKHGIPCPTNRVIKLFFNFEPEITEEIGTPTKYYKALYTAAEGAEIIQRTEGPNFSARSKAATTREEKDLIFNEFHARYLEISKEVISRRPKLTFKKTA